MHVLKAPLKYAESAKRYLLDNLLFDKSYKPKADKTSIYLPLLKKDEEALKKFKGSKIVEEELEKGEQKQTYIDLLKNKLAKKEIGLLPAAYDILGDIIVLDLDESLVKNQKQIGEALLETHKNISTILKKSGNHEGEFRTQKYECIAGKDKRETIYKENNVLLKLDVEKVYFSSRLSTERKRIFQQIKPNEKVLVMFSGCGPYPLTISKNTKTAKIVGIEKNQIAHNYALENLKINKAKNIEFLCGDVREIVPKLTEKFDRIIMPLPKDADTFLDTAFLCSKKGTIIHLYDFEHENEIDLAEKKVDIACSKSNKKYKILRIVKCGQYSPGKFRVCVDFEIK
jgi:tRNA (guanine37-N1)-methyltransferase